MSAIVAVTVGGLLYILGWVIGFRVAERIHEAAHWDFVRRVEDEIRSRLP